ncbi:MAG: hypothetical protein KGI71_05635 [Patescibacteria group bacterium]|nr:hypothetical protein [Patescibacteria group bacterium]
MARLPTAQEDAALDAMFVTSTTYYLSFNTADPGTTGASEWSGAGASRQAITFSAAASGSKASSNSQTFSSIPLESGGLPYFSLWTTSGLGTGTYLGGGTTSGLSGSLPAGATITVASGATTWAQS